MQNESGVLPANKTYDPYTAYPEFGKSFYIGSDEIFNKPGVKLSINISNYLEKDADNTSHINGGGPYYGVSLLVDRQWKYIPDAEGKPKKYTIKELSQNVYPEPFRLNRDPIVNVSEYGSETIKGFIRITNFNRISDIVISDENNDDKSEAVSKEFKKRQIMCDMLKIEKISISYYSELYELCSCDDHIYEIQPFGVVELIQNKIYNQENTDAISDILPVCKKENALFRYAESVWNKKNIRGYYENEGMLYIGFEGARPLDSINMLFQFAEGSADDEDNKMPDIHWSYLSENIWKDMPSEYLIYDGTYGFKKTGIIKITIPHDASNKNTVITDGLHWLCASVNEYSDRVPMMVNIIAHAVEAIFSDHNNDRSHYEHPLLAGSIDKMDVKVPQISKVEQPFASFGGKKNEEGEEFYIRVSERLRHKGRAITAWDYEHLILDMYPDIVNVKCICHSDVKKYNYSQKSIAYEGGHAEPSGEISPGSLLIIPVSNKKNRSAVNRLQPKTSRATLHDIEMYLKGITSPFIKIYVKNPIYEQVLVSVNVKLISGENRHYCKKLLSDELVKYISPWVYDDNISVDFDRKIYSSELIRFIEERQYVDYIRDFQMYQMARDGSIVKQKSDTLMNNNTFEYEKDISIKDIRGRGDKGMGYVAIPTSQRSILVSASMHIIETEEAELFGGEREKDNGALVEKKYEIYGEEMGINELLDDMGDLIGKIYDHDLEKEDNAEKKSDENDVVQQRIEKKKKGGIFNKMFGKGDVDADS